MREHVEAIVDKILPFVRPPRLREATLSALLGEDFSEKALWPYGPEGDYGDSLEEAVVWAASQAAAKYLSCLLAEGRGQVAFWEAALEAAARAAGMADALWLVFPEVAERVEAEGIGG